MIITAIEQIKKKDMSHEPPMKHRHNLLSLPLSAYFSKCVKLKNICNDIDDYISSLWKDTNGRSKD